MSIALVLGSASSVWEDVFRAEHRLGRFWDLGPIVACNDMIALWPERLDHAVTLHTERLPEWVEKRREIVPWEGPPPFTLWTDKAAHTAGLEDFDPPPQQIFLSDDGTGSSGLLATRVGLHVAERALLCGITMDTRPHIRGATPAGGIDGWVKAEKHTEAWVTHKHDLLGRVYAMKPDSWTAMLLGEPPPGFFK